MNTKISKKVDDRTVRTSDPEIRGDRGTSEDSSREVNSNILSGEDFDKFLENEFEQTALPNAPLMPGWHLVWLTTTSQYDSLQKRERLGYIPVRRDELSNFDPSNGQELARYEGFVTCNEMILCKLPEERYQAIMRHFHHKKPMQEESGIIDNIKANKASGTNSSTLSVDDDGDSAASGIKEMETGVEYAKRVNPVF